jgi:3D (Asp-Asp-Asp) domain-containing protein
MMIVIGCVAENSVANGSVAEIGENNDEVTLTNGTAGISSVLYSFMDDTVEKTVEEVTPIAGITAALYGIDDVVVSNTTVQKKGPVAAAGYTKTLYESNAISIMENEQDVVAASFEEVEPEPVFSYTVEEKDLGTMYVSAGVLNVRSEPSVDGDVIMKLVMGDSLEVTGIAYIDEVLQEEEAWYEVSTKKGTAYVSQAYLTDVCPDIYLGEYRITYYCNCSICCGQYAGMNKTASGATPVEGITIAADKSIPFGTRLKINGHIYTVQDRGGAITGNHIDIYMNSHSDCLRQTYTKGSVYLVQ